MNISQAKINITCALVVTLAAGVWLFARHGEIADAAIEKRKTAMVGYLRERAVNLLKAEDFNDTNPGRQQKAFQSFFEAVQSPELIRMKVWDRNFTVVWSDLRELIGQRFPDNHDVEEALEGKVEFELNEAKEEHVSERAFEDLSEIYVPFFGPKGEVLGVFEVYQPATALRQQITSEFQKSVLTTSVWAVTAFGVIVLISRYRARSQKTT